ncbi:tail fiber domain-containing protein, partial [Enterobacter bugandensis]|uniref:tail fiber domain-containing protein n=1 Tax=Enterobacter bugandensis TaxID=881260 RepID=UPI002004E596
SAAAAKTSEQNAANSNVYASQNADRAKTEADRAQTANPDNQLKKDQNLSDVTDKAAAWANIYGAQSGPLTLKQNAAGDFDAVTLQQLRAAGSGGGANMSGVMNNFIGAVEWFNGTRAKLPAGYIAADGQELSQTDPLYVDLYTAVSNDVFVTVTEALWQNSGAADNLKKGANRGAYVKQSSTGKFRVPDLNGAYSDGATPGANFLRGDGAGKFTDIIGGVGVISYGGVPDIEGTFYTMTNNVDYAKADGAFRPLGQDVGETASTLSGPDRGDKIQFKASNWNTAFGRSSEVRPNSVTGIWIIRCNGNFTATGTEFSAINSNATPPPADGKTLVQGGEFKSRYNTEGKTRVTSSHYARFPWGGNAHQAEAVFNVFAYTDTPTVAASNEFSFNAAGVLKLPKDGACTIEHTKSGWSDGAKNGAFRVDCGGIEDSFGAGYTITGRSNAGWYGGVCYGTYMHKLGVPATQNTWPWPCIAVAMDDAGAFGLHWELQHGGTGQNTVADVNTAIAQANIVISNNNVNPDGSNMYKVVAWQPSCDSRLKEDITAYDGKQSLANIEALDFKTFKYKADAKHRVRRGVIAQEAQTVDSDYVKEVNGMLSLDTAPLLLDALAAIKVLSARVAELEAKG